MTEGQSARISDLDQNFCFEAQTTLASPWTSFEGFITLITAETKKETTKRREDVKIRGGQQSHIIRTSIVADSHKEAAKPSSTVYLSFVIFYSPCVIFIATCGWFLLVRGKVWSPKNVLDIILNLGFKLLSLSNCLFDFGLWGTLTCLCSWMHT